MSAAKVEDSKREDTKDAIVLAAARHVVFDGWSDEALARGAADAGFDVETAKHMFPHGPIDAIVYLADVADRAMAQAMEKADVENMRVRACIIFAVRARLEFLAPYREAVRRGLGILMRPNHALRMAEIVHNTVDAIWRLSGDRAVDFSYYTKRGLLAAVYGPVVLYWLADGSENYEDTWDFLERRIDDVLKIPSLKARFEKTLQGLWPRRPDPGDRSARMRP